MPTRILSESQRLSFGRFSSPPSAEELARHFHLDSYACDIINKLRGSSNRLGFAILLCSVRFTGAIPIRFSDVPDVVVSYLADQLGCLISPDIEDYFDSSSPTFKRHCVQIRAAFGFQDFYAAPKAIFGMSRRVYSFCWAGEERPSILFSWAVNWLVAHQIILPGITTLERLIARIRDRARMRLWLRLVDGISPQGKEKIAELFEEENGFTGLELLRASPLKRRQTDFLRHLDRLDNLRTFELKLSPPKGVPATHLERLARVARHAKPSAIAALKEPRRTATVAALFFTLEASAQDDAIELGEALIADLFREAEIIQAAERLNVQKDLEQATLILRDLASMLLSSEDLPFTQWQEALYQQLPRDTIERAIAQVDVSIEPSSRPYNALNRRWRRARKLFSSIIGRIEQDNGPGGQAVMDALQWLISQRDWTSGNWEEAPISAISKPWSKHVLNSEGKVANPRAYVFATIEAWHKAVKRRDIFARPGIRYADPRNGMLEGKDWQTTKLMVCRALNCSLDGAHEVERLADQLHQTFVTVANRADDNPDLSFYVEGTKHRIAVAQLDRLEEPASLRKLRQNIHALMPKGGIPDILLEIMQRTGFAKDFKHLSERPGRVEHFETSLCAVLIAKACNIGFEPLVRNDIPALNQSRLSWINQNFIRADTLEAASARIVSAHKKLPITTSWGDGQIASADGLRFIAPKTAIHAGPNPKYFGQGRGVTWYNMLSDQYSGLGAMVVPGTLRDSLVVLALLLEQETELNPHQIMTDTAAYTDIIFGLFWLLGYQFCPRLADIGSLRLWRVNKTANYGPFDKVVEGTINIKIIIDNWEDLVRLAGSLKLGNLKAEAVIRVLQVRDRSTTLAKALVQLGRLVKTMHILNFVDDPIFRRKILVQLNRQEARHKLARKIYYGERGEVRNALKQGQEEELGALGLALNTIVHWNAIYMQEALGALENQRIEADPNDLARLSPVLWRHINFLGQYEIALPESVQNGGLRPLRDNTYEWEF